MIDNFLSKSKLQTRYEKFIKNILYGKVTANQLTILGLVIGLTSALFIVLSGIFNKSLIFIIFSSLFLIFSFFVDTLDGAVARIEGSTIFGGILDIMCDRTVEICIILSLIYTAPLLLFWPGILSLSAIILCITSFLSVGAGVMQYNRENPNKLIFFPKGFIERGETFIFLFLATIFINLRFYIFIIFAILTFITALQRIINAFHFFKNHKKL